MSTRDLALETLERALDRLISLDPDARRRLAALHGRVIRVDLRGIGIKLDFIPGHDGRVRVHSGLEGEPDAVLEGSPLDLLRAGDRDSGHAELFAGHVRIHGDHGIAQRFSEALAGLDIDWEEQLSRLTGDIAAHEIGRAARALRDQAAHVGRNGVENLSEYLTEEARLLPHRFEVEAFLAEVDTLRDDVERLAARIALLEHGTSQ